MIPLNRDICGKIHPELYQVLTSLQVDYVLNLDEFTKMNGYAPCIASIFLVGKDPCGSFDTTLPSGVTIHVKNGTLSRATSPAGKESNFASVGQDYNRLAAHYN